MNVTGKLVKMLPQESGTSKAGKLWSKDGFILQLESKFPKQLKIDIFNNHEMSSLIRDTAVDTVLSCDINLDSREFNGKWYHNVTLWKAEIVRSESNEINQHAGMNQIAQAHNQQYNRASDVSGSQEDDLPF